MGEVGGAMMLLDRLSENPKMRRGKTQSLSPQIKQHARRTYAGSIYYIQEQIRAGNREFLVIADGQFLAGPYASLERAEKTLDAVAPKSNPKSRPKQSTALYRMQAANAEKNLKWDRAAKLWVAAIAAYPAHSPSSQLAAADLKRLRERLQGAKAMAKSERAGNPVVGHKLDAEAKRLHGKRVRITAGKREGEFGIIKRLITLGDRWEALIEMESDTELLYFRPTQFAFAPVRKANPVREENPAVVPAIGRRHVAGVSKVRAKNPVKHGYDVEANGAKLATFKTLVHAKEYGQAFANRHRVQVKLRKV